jgi:hypothetical protein
MRLIVTGSRGWTDAQVLREALDIFADQAAAAGAPELIVAHGAAYPKPDRHTGRIPAKSADWLTHRWIHDLPHPLPVVEEAHPADWTAPCRPTCKAGHRRPRPKGGSYCPAVGNYRNADLVAPGADAGLALHLDRSTGTADCIRRMEAADIPVQRIVRRSPNLPVPAGADTPTA